MRPLQHRAGASLDIRSQQLIHDFQLESHAIVAVVGRCRLKAVEPRVVSAWFQRLKLTCDQQLTNFAFKFNSRRYTEAVGLCGRYSLVCGSQRGDDADNLWLALLHAVIKPLRKLRGGQRGKRLHRSAPAPQGTIANAAAVTSDSAVALATAESAVAVAGYPAPGVNAQDLTTGALCLALEAGTDG